MYGVEKIKNMDWAKKIKNAIETAQNRKRVKLKNTQIETASKNTRIETPKVEKIEWAFFGLSDYKLGTGCLDILRHTDGTFLVGYDARRILEGDNPSYSLEWLPDLEAVQEYCKDRGF